MFHNSFKEKMDNLEAVKTRISSYINEIKATMNSSALNEKLIEQYLIKDITAINEKSANDLKTIINTYVESVLVHEDKVDINLILFFVHINGGGEGNRTPVRKSVNTAFSGCIMSFKFPLQAAGIQAACPVSRLVHEYGRRHIRIHVHR